MLPFQVINLDGQCMKLGVNSFLFHSPMKTEHLNLLSKLSSWGFDCAELAIENPGDIDAGQVKKAFDASGLESVITCGVFGTDRDLRGTPGQQQGTLDYAKALIEMMPIYESKVLAGPIYSAVGHTKAYSQEERNRQRDQVARNLTELCKVAQLYDVVIAMEVLNRFETDFINTCAQAVELVEMVGSPALKIHLDTFHMNIEERSMYDAITLAGEHLGHFHASASHRGIPGQDTIPWQQVRDGLREIHYDGAVVIESFASEIESIASACCIWRDLGSAESIATQGLSHLQQLLR